MTTTLITNNLPQSFLDCLERPLSECIHMILPDLTVIFFFNRKSRRRNHQEKLNKFQKTCWVKILTCSCFADIHSWNCFIKTSSSEAIHMYHFAFWCSTHYKASSKDENEYHSGNPMEKMLMYLWVWQVIKHKKLFNKKSYTPSCTVSMCLHVDCNELTLGI